MVERITKTVEDLVSTHANGLKILKILIFKRIWDTIKSRRW